MLLYTKFGYLYLIRFQNKNFIYFLSPYFSIWKIFLLCRIITSAEYHVVKVLLFLKLRIYSTDNNKIDADFKNWILSGLKYHTSEYNDTLL